MSSPIVKFIMGILLIPIYVGYSGAFYSQLQRIQGVGTPQLSMLLGATSYLVFHTMIMEPTRLYVFGHELMHAFAAWLTGGKIKDFKAGATQGHVTVDKVTGFVALTPYIVPIYAILAAFLYGAASMFTNIAPWTQWFFFGLGVTLAFHLVFTVKILKQKQSDLGVWGRALSLGIIYWGNLLLIVGTVSLVVPGMSPLSYLKDGFTGSLDAYSMILNQLFSI